MKKNNLKNKKIYVAGHNGMVGSALIRYFKKKGVSKIIFVSLQKELFQSMGHFNFFLNIV